MKISDLPPDVKMKAIKNFESSNGAKWVENVGFDTLHSFIWLHTPEGVDFWKAWHVKEVSIWKRLWEYFFEENGCWTLSIIAIIVLAIVANILLNLN